MMFQVEDIRVMQRMGPQRVLLPQTTEGEEGEMI